MSEFPSLQETLGPPKPLPFPGVIVCDSCRDRTCWCCPVCGAVLGICDDSCPAVGQRVAGRVARAFGRRVVTVELPEQHTRLAEADVIAEFRFGDSCAGATAVLGDDGPRVLVVGGEEDMPLSLAREFALAVLAAVFAGEAVAS